MIKLNTSHDTASLFFNIRSDSDKEYGFLTNFGNYTTGARIGWSHVFSNIDESLLDSLHSLESFNWMRRDSNSFKLLGTNLMLIFEEFSNINQPYLRVRDISVSNEDFPKLVKLVKKAYKNSDILNLGYTTLRDRVCFTYICSRILERYDNVDTLEDVDFLKANWLRFLNWYVAILNSIDAIVPVKHAHFQEEFDFFESYQASDKFYKGLASFEISKLFVLTHRK